jgi:predicted membrane chloride channel (bestrophin family)|tara:strand:+ start:1462 stop:1647 length:186 start_codon:yes stop_codon:yes gene_type:complete
MENKTLVLKQAKNENLILGYNLKQQTEENKQLDSSLQVMDELLNQMQANLTSAQNEDGKSI